MIRDTGRVMDRLGCDIRHGMTGSRKADARIQNTEVRFGSESRAKGPSIYT